jgi:hypothetical protein
MRAHRREFGVSDAGITIVFITGLLVDRNATSHTKRLMLGGGISRYG